MKDSLQFLLLFKIFSDATFIIISTVFHDDRIIMFGTPAMQ